MYGRAAVGEMERGGSPAVANYLDDLDRNAHTQACLFDADGNPIGGHSCSSFQSLGNRAVTSATPAFGFRYGLARVGVRVQGRNGGSYIFATELPAGPRAAFGPNLLGLALHWGVAFLVSGFICYLLTRHLTTPILRLREASRRLASGELTTRAPGFESRHDELGELMRDFNAMGDRIEALVSSQRQLISDVSHELRSPLARLTVALDLARERIGNDPSFDHMEKDFDRLSDMVGRLLTVARLDSSATAAEMKVLNLSALVSEIVADADFEARNRNCTVQLSNEGDIYVRANGDLLRSAIEDVIRNAVRHTSPGTAVDVQLKHPDAGSASCALAVRDHGPGVPDAELENIFRPFYRVASARDRQSGGAGLGLAIADRVAQLHGGKVGAVNAADGGLEIVFNLLVAESSTQVRRGHSSRRAP
jgi:two-component system sensor histidine kinase CpxA